MLNITIMAVIVIPIINYIVYCGADSYLYLITYAKAAKEGINWAKTNI